MRRQKNDREIDFINTINHVDLIDILEHSIQRQQNIQYFQVHMEYFTKVEHILCRKTSLNKYNKIQVIQSMFLDHREIKLEINKDLREIPKYLDTK